MTRTLSQLIWPALVGVMAAMLTIQYAPQLLESDPHSVKVVQVPAMTSEGSQTITRSYAQAVKQAAPSVVSIYTRTERTDNTTKDQQPQFYFNNLGSGVIVSDQGYVVTNNHVIESANLIIVALSDGREGLAKVIGTDPDTDLALLKLEMSSLPSITLTPSDSLQVGDIVLAIGNPFGVGQTVTQGIISGLDRNTLGLNTYEDFIQTDAAINPGNSGGALVTADGYLAGINAAIFSKSGGSQGIGFAIPTKQVQQVMADLIRFGRVVRGWVGVQAHGITTAELKQAGLPDTQRGLMISGVYQDSPALKAGLLPGDVLTQINQTPVVGTGLEAMNYIAKVPPGEIVQFTVLREGKERQFQIKTSERPRSQ